MYHQEKKRQHRAHFLVWSLSLGGFIPFGLLAAMVVTDIDFSIPSIFTPLQLFIIWSAVILTFLGGIRWGLALSVNPPNTTDLLLCVIPAIVVLFSFGFAPETYLVLILLIFFVIHGVWDYLYLKYSIVPDWFSGVRLVVTICVTITQLAVFLSLK
ncbi:MAG: DUF3429 domain-containing protein [Pseudomonadota bacterium]